MHRLLARQLKKSISQQGDLNLRQLCDLVDRAYEDMDTNQKRADRANSLMTDELEALNGSLNEAVDQLQLKNAWFEAAMNNTPQGICLFDEDQRLLVSNDAYATIYGLSPSDIKTGMAIEDILTLRIGKGVFVGETPDEYMTHYIGNSNGKDWSVRHFTLSTSQEIEILHQPMKSGGYLSIHTDITERFEAEQKIKGMAHMDVLTGLPNRAKIYDVLPSTLSQAVQNGSKMALLYIDLDGFKGINDTHGHPIGDFVLKEVANRLLSRLGNDIMVGRMSGDEFMVIIDKLDAVPDLDPLCTNICVDLAKPIETPSGDISISASIGIAIGPPPNQSSETLIQYADLALYQAKSDGSNCHRFFEEEMFTAASERRQLANDLKTATVNGELLLHYQPQINFRSGEIIGYEALLRWNHPRIGVISPLKFISIAEETGQICNIGEWVLRTACAYATTWSGNEKIAINLSAVQFLRQDVVAMVRSALDDTGLAPKRLELEITESVMIQGTSSVIEVLQELNSMGISIALDDFGTGFSSLNYLTRFPFQKIKIDKTFIDDIDDSSQITPIVSLIIGLGRSLNVTITAEGIENYHQHEALRSAGCNEGQGYLYGKPQPKKLERTAARPIHVVV